MINDECPSYVLGNVCGAQSPSKVWGGVGPLHVIEFTSGHGGHEFQTS